MSHIMKQLGLSIKGTLGTVPNYKRDPYVHASGLSALPHSLHVSMTLNSLNWVAVKNLTVNYPNTGI